MQTNVDRFWLEAYSLQIKLTKLYYMMYLCKLFSYNIISRMRYTVPIMYQIKTKFAVYFVYLLKIITIFFNYCSGYYSYIYIQTITFEMSHMELRVTHQYGICTIEQTLSVQYNTTACSLYHIFMNLRS